MSESYVLDEAGAPILTEDGTGYILTEAQGGASPISIILSCALTTIRSVNVSPRLTQYGHIASAVEREIFV